jgi:hypothetical protein
MLEHRRASSRIGRNLFGSSPRTNGQYDFAGPEKHQTNPEKEPRRYGSDLRRQGFRFWLGLQPRLEALTHDRYVRDLPHNAAPLQQFLDREDVTELVINEPGWIGVETRNGWEWHEAPTLDYPSLMTLAKLIAGLTKQDISSEIPICSSVLPGGERAQVVIPLL